MSQSTLPLLSFSKPFPDLPNNIRQAYILFAENIDKENYIVEIDDRNNKYENYGLKVVDSYNVKRRPKVKVGLIKNKCPIIDDLKLLWMERHYTFIGLNYDEQPKMKKFYKIMDQFWLNQRKGYTYADLPSSFDDVPPEKICPEVNELIELHIEHLPYKKLYFSVVNTYLIPTPIIINIDDISNLPDNFYSV